MVDVVAFVIAGAIVLGGALGVVGFSNPVHAALSLIASFFGVAVIFIIQNAQFLALVQVVVYAGAIVVLFLFVIMLLGVDTSENLRVEPLVGQRPLALTFGALMLALILGGLFLSGPGGSDGAVAITGQTASVTPLVGDDAISGAEAPSNVEQLGADLFGRNILAVQATALLLTIATVGAVVLVTNRGAEDLVIDEPGRALEANDRGVDPIAATEDAG